MNAETIFLYGPPAVLRAQNIIARAPEGYVVKIAAPTRTDDQNRKMHPMLKDIQEQVPRFNMSTTEDIKLRFLNALGVEMRFLDELEGEGLFPVGLRSSTLTVQQFSALLELIYAYGAKHGVVWTDPNEAEEAA